LLYQRMAEQGIAMIPAIQGPPKMDPDILLRQTSFQALVEPTRFPGGQGSSEGKHRARFGEIEQRGVALTPQGRALYDEAIGRVEARAKQKDPQYRSVLEEEFAAFPRGAETLRRQGLAYFTYRATPEGKAQGIALKGMPLDQLVARGFVAAAPITYEDFLPVSAAGIFKSNLVDGGTASVEKSQKSSRAQMEHIIGAPIADPFALYAAQEARSLGQAYQALGLSLSTAQQQQLRLAEEADPVRRKAGGQTP